MEEAVSFPDESQSFQGCKKHLLCDAGRKSSGLLKIRNSGNPMPRMKMVQTLLIIWFFGVAAQGNLFAAAPDDLLASSRFVGGTALANNTSASKLKAIWALPETREFQSNVLHKAASLSASFLGGNASDEKQGGLLRPLLDDLLGAESIAELRGTTPANAELYLAVQLKEDRARLWETNLLQAAKAKAKPAKIDDASGWQTKIGQREKFLHFYRAGKWTVLVIGQEQAPARADFLKRLRAAAAPRSWLEADLDLPRLKMLLPEIDAMPVKLARAQFQIIGQGENLRTTARIIYPEKIDWKPDAWNIPKNTIRDPLISFTAGRRLAPFFKPWQPADQLGFNPLTNQIYFWAQSQMPFQSYFALPVKEATNVLKVLAPKLAKTFNPVLEKRNGGMLNISSNQTEVLWQNLPPIIVPFLRPAKETNGMELLLGGLFPLVPSTNVPPAELFAQVTGSSNLVFYDWEITEARLSQARFVSQLLPFFSAETVKTNANGTKRYSMPWMPQEKWLMAIGPKLGNTVTEITFKGPNELNVVRKSHLGLNSSELIFLSHWLATKTFPPRSPFVPAIPSPK